MESRTGDRETLNGAGPTIVVATLDPNLLDRVLSVTAAVGVDPLVFGDPSALRPHWSSAAMVLIGADAAPRVAALALPRRAEVYVLTDDEAPDLAYRWSVPLGAAVVTLPSAASWLTAAVADQAARSSGSGRLVAVLSGSGGAGGSTLAAGLAHVSARVLAKVMLIDADPRGGGLDLLLGAERLEGWRWGRLASARGHLGDLSGHLPCVDEVEVLAMGRGDSSPGWAPDSEQLSTVLAATSRSHDLTVVDLPRDLDPTCWAALDAADQLIMVVRGDVRGVAAARELMRGSGGAEFGVVVRHGRVRVLSAETVADGLGLPLLGVMADEPGLALGADRGEPPARSTRSPLARLCRALLDDLTARSSDALMVS